MHTRIRRQKGVIRPLNPADPRSLDHPSHDEQWLELARALGRSMARAQYERDKTDEAAEPEDRRDLRPLLK